MWGHHAKWASPSEARRSSASDPSLHVPRSPFQTPLVKKEVQTQFVFCVAKEDVSSVAAEDMSSVAKEDMSFVATGVLLQQQT